MTLTPGLAAKRQWLRDRYAEQLEAWGAANPDACAGQLLDIALNLGWAPPHADGDADEIVPPRFVPTADPDHRAACKAEIDDVLSGKKRIPARWAAERGLTILDADGWRADGTPLDQPITREEFDRRLALSTAGPTPLP